jgi:peptide/nickel transport system permease protein
MNAYIVRRLLLAGLILWLLSVVVFLLLRITPGDPALVQLGVNATPETIAALRREMGVDRSYPRQYLEWLGGLLTGDLGRSVVTRQPVWPEFRERFPISLQLMVMTLGWTVLLGIPAGVLSARRRNSLPDYAVRLFAITALSVPAFWVATLVLLIPAQQWGYAPPLNRQISIFDSPWDNLRQFGPASLVLALGPIAVMMRLTRSTMLEVLRADFIRTAWAKGLRARTVVYRHALQNSLIPVVTVLGLQVAGLLGGAVIIEQIFGLRGLGQFIFNAINKKDFTVAQTLVMYTAAVVVLLNLAVDLTYAVLDPRIRYY